MNILKLIKSPFTWKHCTTCNFVDVCLHNTDLRHRYLPPLSKRGKERDCFECGHSYWAIDRDRGVRTCMMCHLVKQLNDDSAKVKHQR